MTTTPEPGQRAPDDIEKLAKRLDDGCVYREKRWSGDTHGDLGGSIDEDETDKLMREAAAELRKLEGERDAARNYAVEVRIREKAAEDARVSAVDRATVAEANYHRVWNERDAERRRAEAAQAVRDWLREALRRREQHGCPDCGDDEERQP